MADTYGNGEMLQWLDERHRRLHSGERKSGSVQESVGRRDFAGVLILPKSGYTRQHARDRLDQGVRVAWVSGVPTRNQRSRQDAEVVGAA